MQVHCFRSTGIPGYVQPMKRGVHEQCLFQRPACGLSHGIPSKLEVRERDVNAQCLAPSTSSPIHTPSGTSPIAVALSQRSTHAHGDALDPVCSTATPLTPLHLRQEIRLLTSVEEVGSGWRRPWQSLRRLLSLLPMLRRNGVAATTLASGVQGLGL